MPGVRHPLCDISNVVQLQEMTFERRDLEREQSLETSIIAQRRLAIQGIFLELETLSRENRSPRQQRRGRASISVIPSLYSRTPLHDGTDVARAPGRKRGGLTESDGEQTEGQVPLDPHLAAISYAQLHNKENIPPPFTFVQKVHKVLHEVSNQTDGEILTPSKKLLNELDTVEKVVMEELRKMKRTPSVKKAESQSRVRTLMSFR